MSYLNAKPLIHGLEQGPVDLQLDVPSALIGRLTRGDVDLGLCSIVDYFRHAEAIELVPVGGIGCAGPTLTVRLFSRVPIEAITTVHADTDSHTSVLLLRVLLHDLYQLSPEMIHYDTRTTETAEQFPEAVLLIGDKVVTDAPPATVYPYQLDLGGAWHDLTGKPFVFATWMKRKGTPLGELPALLEQQLATNLNQLDQIVQTYAAPHGWPSDLASEYLGNILRFTVGTDELDAIEMFSRRLRELDLIEAGPGSLTRG